MSNVVFLERMPDGSIRREELAPVEEVDFAAKTLPSADIRPADPSRRMSRSLQDILDKPTQVRWLLPDILEAAVIGLLFGPRGAFKSFAALHWTMTLALKGVPVLVLSAEGAGFDRRARAWLKVHAPDADFATLPVRAIERRMDLFGDDESIALVKMEVEELAREAGKAVGLVTIDTYSKFSGTADENSNDDAKRFVGRLDNHIRTPYGCTVLVIGHTGLSDAGRPRGASALAADTDAEYIASRKEGSDVVSISRNRFKDSRELPPLSYQAQIVDLGYVDDRGENVTSIALAETVMPVRIPAAKTVKPTGKLQKRLYETVIELSMEGEAVVIEDLVSRVVDTKIRGKGEKPQKHEYRDARDALTAMIGRFIERVDEDHVKLKGAPRPGTNDEFLQ